jgi:tRNA (cmo5U34)-methyltransferase
MADSAPQIFDRHAADYDAPRRRLIPPFDAFYGTAVDALGLLGGPPKRILDLGAGTGLLARKVAEAQPQAQLTLLDGSPKMLEQAQATLGDRASYVVADLADELPKPNEGRWCAIVSALAIHHLEHPQQQDLYKRIHDALAPGGIFVNAEQVEGASDHLAAHHVEWHHRGVLANGGSEEEWLAAVERMQADRRAPIFDQLRWLDAAGFATVDCLFKDHRFAVLIGMKQAG